MGKETWRVLAIISIIVNILFVVLLIWGINLADTEIENENICYYDVCDVDNVDSPSYDYDFINGVCYCYNQTNHIIQEAYLG